MLYTFYFIFMLFRVLGPRAEIWFVAALWISGRNISCGKLLRWPSAQTSVFFNVLVPEDVPLCLMPRQSVSLLQVTFVSVSAVARGVSVEPGICLCTFSKTES